MNLFVLLDDNLFNFYSDHLLTTITKTNFITFLLSPQYEAQ